MLLVHYNMDSIHVIANWKQMYSQIVVDKLLIRTALLIRTGNSTGPTGPS